MKYLTNNLADLLNKVAVAKSSCHILQTILDPKILTMKKLKKVRWILMTKSIEKSVEKVEFQKKLNTIPMTPLIITQWWCNNNIQENSNTLVNNNMSMAKKIMKMIPEEWMSKWEVMKINN